MAGSGSASRAIYAGLSCGFVFAVPVAAYVATSPFSEANSVVTACALPFTVGALAGVGILSAVSAVGSHRAQEDEAEAPQPSRAYRAAASSADRGKDKDGWFSGSSKVPKGVPVIARAEGALSEAEAWEDLDAILSERSPISCDAAHSKDIYQIAFEELQRGSAATAQRPAGSPFPSTGSTAQQPAVRAGARTAATPYATGAYAAAASRPAATASTAVPAAYATGSVSVAGAAADPYSTSSFVSSYAAGASQAPRADAAGFDTFSFMAQASAGSCAHPSSSAQRTGSVYAAPAGSASVPAPAFAAAPSAAPATASHAGYGAASAPSFDQDELDTQAAQRAALASLDEIDGSRLRAGAAAVTAPAAPSAASSEARIGTRFAQTPHKAERQGDRPTRAAGHEAHNGRADIWASAIDILMEDEPAAPASASAATGAIHVARHMRRADGGEDALRAAAIAEGQRANAMHQHVNSLIEEEFDQVSSSSVRRSSHEYLRVIQGGTAAMPRLQAEA